MRTGVRKGARLIEGRPIMRRSGIQASGKVAVGWDSWLSEC